MFHSLRFGLTDLLLIVTAICIAFGFVSIHGLYNGIFVGLLVIPLAFLILRGWRACAVVIAVYALVIACSVGNSILDVRSGGTYAVSFNHRLERIAVESNLVGADEDLIERTLGPADIVYSGWSVTSIETGEPTADAEYVTTYKYCPYPLVPFSAFEVHCRKGKVSSYELLDD